MFNKKKRKKDMEENQTNVEQEEVSTEQTQETSEETTKTKEEELEEKLEELNKKYLLLYSDFENFRKRTSKEKIELIQNAAENTIKDLLPVVDDYERALANFEKFEDEKFIKAKEGIELIYNKLMSILTQKGHRAGLKIDRGHHLRLTQNRGVCGESYQQAPQIDQRQTSGHLAHGRNPHWQANRGPRQAGAGALEELWRDFEKPLGCCHKHRLAAAWYGYTGGHRQRFKGRLRLSP